MSPVSRTVPKAQRRPLCWQNFWFLVKIKGRLRLKQIRISRIVPKKIGLKKQNSDLAQYF